MHHAGTVLTVRSKHTSSKKWDVDSHLQYTTPSSNVVQMQNHGQDACLESSIKQTMSIKVRRNKRQKIFFSRRKSLGEGERDEQKNKKEVKK